MKIWPGFTHEIFIVMKKYDIIALGELNVDLLFNGMRGLPVVGKEILAGNMALALGSSTAIFAANASALGADVAFLGMIGKDVYGDFIQKELALKGVDISNLIVKPDLKTGITVSMNYGEERASVTYPGAMSEMGLSHIRQDIISQAKHIHISSVFLQKNIQNDLAAIVRMIKGLGVTVSLDTQWDPSEKWLFDAEHILPYVDLFLPNEKEFLCVSGQKRLEDALEKMSRFANVIVIKMGAKGSMLIKKDGSRRLLPAFLNEKVVDAVGAGDSFNAGFVTSFVKGYELEECQRRGNLMGAVNTTAAGGTSAFSSFEHIKNMASGLFGQDVNL